MHRIAERLPFTYSGADLYALCSDSMLKAIARRVSTVDEKVRALPDGPVSMAYYFDHLASEEDTEITVTEEDFMEAQRDFAGSIRYLIYFSFSLTVIAEER